MTQAWGLLCLLWGRGQEEEQGADIYLSISAVCLTEHVLCVFICAQSSRLSPPIIMWVFSLYIWWVYFRALPYYNNWINHAISGFWLGIAYTCGVLMLGVWDDQDRYGDPAWSVWMTQVREHTCMHVCVCARLC